MKKDIITTLEISDSWLKLGQLNVGGRGNPVITVLGFKNIEGMNDQDIGRSLSQLLAEKKTKLSQLILIIPRRQAMLTHFQLPSIQDQEINQMVGMQIINSVPYGPEDIVYDYIILEKNPSGYSKVLAMALHRDLVGRYLRILEKFGAHPKRITLSSLGCHQWYLYQKSKSSQLKLGAVLVMNVDEKYCDLCFINQDKLIFSREISFNLKDWDRPEPSDTFLNHFLNQMSLTVSNYKRSNMGVELSNILLVSADPKAGTLAEQLGHEYNLPVAVINPLDNITLTKNFVVPEVVSHQGVSLTALLGPLVYPSGDKINLFPKELKANRQAQQKKKEWLTTAVLGALAFILLTLSFGVKNFEEKRNVSVINQERQHIKKDLKLAQDKLKNLELIKKYVQETPRVINILYEIYTVVPEGMTLNLLDLDNKGILTLDGYFPAGMSVNDLQESLVHLPRFKNVTLKYANKENSPSGELTHFNITCELNPEKEGH